MIRIDRSGAGTALLGKEAAMACTVAVESVIGEHYNKSVDSSSENENIDDDRKPNISSQLRDLMEHADQVKDKDLIDVRNNKTKNVDER